MPGRCHGEAAAWCRKLCCCKHDPHPLAMTRRSKTMVESIRQQCDWCTDIQNPSIPKNQFFCLLCCRCYCCCGSGVRVCLLSLRGGRISFFCCAGAGGSLTHASWIRATTKTKTQHKAMTAKRDTIRVFFLVVVVGETKHRTKK